MVFTASLLRAQHKKGIVWKTSPQACLLCPWARHLRDASIFTWQTGGVPVLHRVTIVKLLTQHVVRGDSWVPTKAVRIVGDGATSHS